MSVVCPFCKHDPYHYVDVGVGFVPVAVVCCDEGIEFFSDRKADNTGLDDGPPISKREINSQKKQRCINYYLNSNFSARQIALLLDVSHDTTARWVRGLQRSKS